MSETIYNNKNGKIRFSQDHGKSGTKTVTMRVMDDKGRFVHVKLTMDDFKLMLKLSTKMIVDGGQIW